jgi:hypothetical protein
LKPGKKGAMSTAADKLRQAEIDELDSAKIGEFEAERIDNVQNVKKLVKCVGIYSKGYTFPEQGLFLSHKTL